MIFDLKPPLFLVKIQIRPAMAVLDRARTKLVSGLTKSKSDSVVLRQPSNTAVGQLTDLGQVSTSLADISSSPSQSSSSSLSSSLSNSTTSISGQGEQPDASTKEGEGSENTNNNEIQSDAETPSSSTSSSSVSSIGSEESLASSNSTPNLPAEAPSSAAAAASTTQTHLKASEQTTSEATTEQQEQHEHEQAVAVPSSNGSQPQTGARPGVGSDEGATRCTLLLRGVADYERAMILPADAWFCEVRGILEGLAEAERRQQETLARRRSLFLEQVLAERNYTNILYLVLSEFRTPLVNRRVVSPQQSAVLFDDLSRLQDEHLAVLPKMERLLIRWNEAADGGGGGCWRAEDGAAYVRLVEQLRRVFALAYPLYICYASTVQGLLEGLRDKSPIFVQFCAQLNKTHGREGALERLLRSPAEHLHGSLEVFARLLDCTPRDGEGEAEAEATRLLVETLTELDMAVHRQQDNATLLQSIHERIVQGHVQMRKAGLGSLAKVPFRVHLIESEVMWYHRAGSGSRAQNQWTHHHFFLLSDCLIAAAVKESQPTSTRRDRKPQHATTTTTSDGDSSSSSSSSLSSSLSSSSSQQQLKFKAAFPLRHLHPSTNESGSVPTITAPPTFPTGELWSKAAEVNPVLVRFYESPDEQDPAKARHLIFVLPTAASRRRWLDHLTQACHRIGHLVLSTEEKHRNREMLSTNEAWHPV